MSNFKAFITHPVVVALLTALAMWIAGWVRTFLAKRVRYQGPEGEAIKKQGETIEKIVTTVNMLVDIKEPELDLLIALGEAAEGFNDGNVATALANARDKREVFKGFLGKAACIEVGA